MRFSTQQVHYFLAAVREQNFTRAAKSCGVKQPTLSQSLKELEASLGGTLFRRAHHAVRPHLAAVARAAVKAGETARVFCQATDSKREAQRGPLALVIGGEGAGLI